MALRDVLIRLRLDDSQFKAKMASAAASTKTFGTSTASSVGQGSKSLGLLKSSYATVGLAAGAAGVASVRAAADFEQAMANVRATGAASGKQLAALGQQALEFGRTTTYSATEAAGGIEALLKAGLSAKDVMGKNGGLAASLDLAAASNLDVGAAAEATAIALSQFKLTGEDASHVADLLAAGAGKSVGEVSDMSMALNQSGLVAKSAGLSIEETTAALAAFAKGGLIGSDAGTSFKTMLQRLVAPTDESRARMEDLGISAYDAQGNFQGLAHFSGSLRGALAEMSDEQRQAELATIFGSDAVRAATLLYEQGEGGVRKWQKAVNDSGYASEVAAQKTDTLYGDLDRLKNSLSTFATGAGSDGADGLRPLIQGLDTLVDLLAEADRTVAGLSLTKESSGGIDDLKAWLRSAVRGGGETFGPGVSEAISKIPTDVVVQISQQGAEVTQEQIQELAATYFLLPEQVEAYLSLLGVPAAQSQLSEFEQGLFSIGAQTAQPQIAPMLDEEPISRALLGLDDLDGATATSILDADPSGAITGGKKANKAVNSAKQNKSIPIDADPSKAIQAAKDAKAAIEATTAVMTIVQKVKKAVVGPAAGGAIEQGTLWSFANGGHGPRARGAVTGPGGPEQDSIPAMLSNGEHVLTASDVRKAGGQDAIFRMRNQIQAGMLKFAGGGAITPLELARAQQRIEQLQTDLAEVESIPKKNGRASKKKRLRLRGIDRAVAQLELADAAAELAALKAGRRPGDEFGSSDFGSIGGFNLSSAFDTSNSPWVSGSFSGAGWMQQRLSAIKTFGAKLVELKKRGLGGLLLKEITDMGIDGGTRAANALLSGPASEVAALQSAYAQIQSYQTGISEFVAGTTPTIQVAGFRIDDWREGIGEIQLSVAGPALTAAVGAIR